jgi:hypothetical protein
MEPKLISLSQAIRAGARNFIEIGGDQAYFGDPAAATSSDLPILLNEGVKKTRETRKVTEYEDRTEKCETEK